MDDEEQKGYTWEAGYAEGVNSDFSSFENLLINIF